MLWDVDETGRRPFETRFRLFRLSGATEETLCSHMRLVAWVRDGHALDKGIGKYLGKGLLYVSYPRLRSFLPFPGCFCRRRAFRSL